MDELASVSIGAILLLLEAFAHFSFIIFVSVFPGLEFLLTVGKRTFITKFTLSGHKVLTHFGLVLNSEVTVLRLVGLLVAEMSTRPSLHLTVVVSFYFTIPVIRFFFESGGIPRRAGSISWLTFFLLI